jgi:hypothetical protein
VFHWTTVHERIGREVSSYYVSGPEGAALIDPRVPDEGLAWFETRARPSTIVLTNRHHYRDSDRFVAAFDSIVWCHSAGLHEFTHGEVVRGFDFGDRLPAGIEAVAVGAICPDETALFIPWARAVAVADGVTRRLPDGPLSFVPDFLLGDDPSAVKDGLCASYARLLDRDFDHLLLAHGQPWVAGAKEALRGFIRSHTEG